MQKLIIFDCDGVLLDSETLVNDMLVDQLAQHGAYIEKEESLKLLTGLSAKSAYEKIAEVCHRNFTQNEIDDIQSFILTELAKKVQAVSGITTLLTNIQKSGLLYCLASSGTFKKINNSLHASGLDIFFNSSNIFSATLVAHGKPAPDLFLYSAAQMSIAPENCIVIEDSIFGIKAAKAAGMGVIGFLTLQYFHKINLLNKNIRKLGNDIDAFFRYRYILSGIGI